MLARRSAPALRYRGGVNGGRRADQALDGHEPRQLLLAPAVSARGSARQHHPAHVASAVVDAHLDMVWQAQFEPLRQHAARVAHDSLLVAVVAVPPRRGPQEVVRITGGERAHYEGVRRRGGLGEAKLAKSARGSVWLWPPPPAFGGRRPANSGAEPARASQEARR